MIGNISKKMTVILSIFVILIILLLGINLVYYPSSTKRGITFQTALSPHNMGNTTMDEINKKLTNNTSWDIENTTGNIHINEEGGGPTEVWDDDYERDVNVTVFKILDPWKKIDEINIYKYPNGALGIQGYGTIVAYHAFDRGAFSRAEKYVKNKVESTAEILGYSINKDKIETDDNERLTSSVFAACFSYLLVIVAIITGVIYIAVYLLERGEKNNSNNYKTMDRSETNEEDFY